MTRERESKKMEYGPLEWLGTIQVREVCCVRMKLEQESLHFLFVAHRSSWHRENSWHLTKLGSSLLHIAHPGGPRELSIP